MPALDAILFLQPRKSQIDVVQAVGRVMRKAEGKRHGYIILPVVVPSGEDPERALDRNDAFSHVWQVLQALRATTSVSTPTSTGSTSIGATTGRSP